MMRVFETALKFLSPKRRRLDVRIAPGAAGHPKRYADKHLRPPTARSDIVAFILPSRLHDKPKRPLQTSYAASVADTLFWPRRDRRRFLLPRPRIQDEPSDFACRIPDESDPGVIFVVDGEFVAGCRHERRR